MNNSVETEQSQAPKDPGRRRALKWLVGSGAALAAGSLVTQETQAANEGINISDNQFLFLTERHDKGTHKETLSDKLTVNFREVSLDAEAFSYDPQKLLSMKAVMSTEWEKIPVDLFQEGVLEKLAQNGTKIMYGDVDLGMNSVALDLISRTSTLAGIIAFTANFIDLEKGDKIQEKLQEKKSRRTLLKKMLLMGTSVWGVSSLPFEAEFRINISSEQNNAIQNVFNELNAIQSNFHPENLRIFFRNLVITNNLLTMIEKSNSEGKKEIVGINVGNAHKGIEELLRAGHDFCRLLIAQYPNAFIKHVIETVGGIENFCSSRVITLPKDFKIGDLENTDKADEINKLG